MVESLGDDSQTLFLDPGYATELDPNRELSMLIQERTLTPRDSSLFSLMYQVCAWFSVNRHCYNYLGWREPRNRNKAKCHLKFSTSHSNLSNMHAFRFPVIVLWLT